MPKGIGQRSIGGRAGIGRRQIANRYGLTNAQEPYMFGLGTHTFTTPKSGYWKFVAWGGGGSTAAVDVTGGGSGGYAEKTVHLLSSQSVTVSINGSGVSTLTFPDSSTVVCGVGGPGSAPAGGTATGGDVNIAGSADNTAGGGTNGGKGGIGAGTGGGAPANLPYRGGDGGDLSSLVNGGVPGGGAAAGGAARSGGGALVIVSFIRD